MKRCTRRRMLLVSLAVASGALVLACATRLRPAPEALATPGAGQGAVERDAGVRVEARVGAWQWDPEQLDRELTPVLVEIDNGSDRTLRLRFDAFALVDGAGRAFAALPPFDIEADVAEPVPTYAYGLHRFHVAPHLSHHFPHLGVHRGLFAHHPRYYGSYYPRWREVELPTEAMLARALPEGVLDPDGKVTGFVYFERVEDPAGDEVSFRFALFDAETEQRFGTIEIPFETTSGLVPGGAPDRGYGGD